MAGHICVGHCEKDKFAIKAYNAIYEPKESEWFAQDITTIDPREIPHADIWCFGFPCQDISVAKGGGQMGLSGERSGLFFAVTNLIREIPQEDRPPFLFIENVKNLLSVNQGWDFFSILIEMDEIGYDVQWQVLNSADYIPQNRERIFLIGCLRGRGGRKIFPIPIQERTTAIKHIQQIGNLITSQTRKNPQAGRIYDPSGIAPTLSTMQGGYQVPLTFIDLNPQPKTTAIARCLQARYYKGYSSHYGAGSGVLIGSPRSAVPIYRPDKQHVRANGRRMKNDGEDMFTLTATDHHGIYDGYRIRKLTPKECWRLQGFPDWAFDKAKAAGLSDTQLYKQAGNAVTVDVIYEIAKRFNDPLAEAEDDQIEQA